MRIILAFVGIVLLINSASARIRHLPRSYSFKQERMHPLSDEFIEYLNSSQTLWSAGRNFHKYTPWSYIRNLMGTYEEDPKNYEIFLDEAPKHEVKELPKNFDSRESWPYCESISEIRDQGSCSSCWAVGVASVMSDRICILTSATETVYISEEDILGCCHDCIAFSSVCLGGSAIKAWGFTKRVGVVSGGAYNSKGGCKAYHIKPCNHEYSGRRARCQQKTEIQNCVSTCTTNSEIDYKFDKKRFTHIYNIPYSANEESPRAMSDIMAFGPITALLSVYDDFIHYKSGIYRRTNSANNTFIGNHTVKIIGWGVDEVTDTKYWIVANSWNSDWGDHGFFKIVRDENHCNIESHLNAGKL